jgi:endo-1,3-1,4-beta-glycanase ExoK
LYADNSATEADIEIEGQRPNEAQATTWTSEQTSQDHQPINTAASSRLVVYKIVWAPQGIQYYADGRLFVPIGTPLRPTVPAQLLFNLWGTNSGEFGGPVTTGATRSLFVTWVRYTPPGATPLPLA